MRTHFFNTTAGVPHKPEDFLSNFLKILRICLILSSTSDKEHGVAYDNIELVKSFANVSAFSLEVKIISRSVKKFLRNLYGHQKNFLTLWLQRSLSLIWLFLVEIICQCSDLLRLKMRIFISEVFGIVMISRIFSNLESSQALENHGSLLRHALAFEMIISLNNFCDFLTNNWAICE